MNSSPVHPGAAECRPAPVLREREFEVVIVRRVTEHLCLWCGTWFSTRWRSAAYCGSTCRAASARWRNREARERCLPSGTNLQE